MSGTRFYCTLCSLFAAASLSCYRSGSVSVSNPTPGSSSAQPARAVEDQESGAATPAGVIATSASADDAASREAIDAEDVLNAALARASDQKKLLLVHLGSPG